MEKVINVECDGFKACATVEYDYLIEEDIPVYSIKRFEVTPKPTADDEKYLCITQVLLDRVKEVAEKGNTWKE